MSEKIKFTVIIPTRERADTLLHCLRTIVSQDYCNLSIIVSDNFSQDNTKEVVDSFLDPRIKYINTGKRISMSHNWEFALSHVVDGWVTFVGDDDGLLPGALTKINEIIKKTNCLAITSNWCFYNWPDSSTGKNDLLIPVTSGFETRRSSEWLNKLMQGKANYPDLPCIYTGGFVDMSAINLVRAKGESFFLSMTPDVYSAIAIASVIDNYVFLKEPIAVAGRSSHSNGASTLGLGKNLTPAQKFFSENNIPFHKLLLDGAVKKSIPILVYECYLQSINLHNNYLDIKLSDQIVIALTRIEPQYYEDLRNYCVQIAEINNLDMGVIERRVKYEKKFIMFRHIRNLYLSFRWLSFTVNQFGTHNVYDATLLAKAAYLIEKEYKYWKLKKIAIFLKKTIARIFVRNRSI